MANASFGRFLEKSYVPKYFFLFFFEFFIFLPDFGIANA